MTTSLTPSSISAIPKDGKPTDAQVAYFNRRLRRDLHGLILNCFLEEQRDHELTKAELARRLDRDPASINRWLATPMNQTIETVSSLLLAMGYVPNVTARKLSEIVPANEFHELFEQQADLAISTEGGSVTVVQVKPQGALSFDTPTTSNTTSSIARFAAKEVERV
jgi:hypothetical protein